MTYRLLSGLGVFAIAAILAGTVPSNAQEAAAPPTSEIGESGTGIICDTPDQVREYVEMALTGADMDTALMAVNSNAGGEHNACAVLPVYYQKHEVVDTVSSPEAGTMLITRITITAIITPVIVNGVHVGNAVNIIQDGMEQYTMFRQDPADDGKPA